MSATTEELKIDLDAADAEAAKKAAEKAKKDDPVPEIEVIKTEPEAKTPERQVLKPEEGLEKLKKQLEDEKAARIDADRRAQEASEAEVRARTEKQSTELDLVANAIATVTQANDQLEEKYAAALTAQDFAGAAKINREMSANSAKLLQLENGKANLERAPKPQARTPTDPVDAFASRLTPRSASWVREHPEYVRDVTKNRKMLAAHELALADGIKPDTDEYFDAIEQTLKIKPEPIVDRDDDPTKEAARRKPAPAAAPVARSGNGQGGRPNVVTLSPAEVEMAKMMDMTPEQYAREKIAIEKEKKH